MAASRGQDEFRRTSGNGSSSRCNLSYDQEAAQPDRINSFSLVGYIPGALGDFLTKLREDLVSGCVARSHVTVLPPRPIYAPAEQAEELLRTRVVDYPPFEVVMPGLRVFDQTLVVYAEITTGRDRLFEMHSDLNTGPLYFQEPYPYHPHVTLAQGIPPEALPATYELALRRWEDEAPARSFVVDTLTFVQNTSRNCWQDLQEYDLRGALATPTR